MTSHAGSQGGRKVTPFSGIAHRRSDYGTYYYRYRSIDPQREQQRIRDARAEYFRQHGPGTIGDAAGRVLTVAGSHVGWFRLVDANGKPYGRRYTLVRKLPQSLSGGVCDCLVVDQHGNEGWLNGTDRARYVAQQREDYHSYASRVLTRSHKQED